MTMLFACVPCWAMAETPDWSAVQKAADDEGAVKVYSTLPTAAWAPIAQAFQISHPGIDLQHERLTSIAGIFEKFQAESGDAGSKADVLLANDVDNWPRLADSGQLAKFSPPDAHQSRAQALFTYSCEPQMFLVNEKSLDAGLRPSSLRELAKMAERSPDTFRGKIGSYDPFSSPFSYAVLWNMKMHDPRAFWKSMKVIAPMMKLEKTAGELLAKTKSGAFAVSIYFPQPFLPDAAAMADANLSALLPADGLPVFPRTLAAASQSSHPNAAKVFVDFMLSAKGQATVDSAASCAGGEKAAKSTGGRILVVPDARMEKDRAEFTAHLHAVIDGAPDSGQWH